jgi:hypothetical protein
MTDGNTARTARTARTGPARARPARAPGPA